MPIPKKPKASYVKIWGLLAWRVLKPRCSLISYQIEWKIKLTKKWVRISLVSDLKVVNMKPCSVWEWWQKGLLDWLTYSSSHFFLESKKIELAGGYKFAVSTVPASFNFGSGGGNIGSWVAEWLQDLPVHLVKSQRLFKWYVCQCWPPSMSHLHLFYISRWLLICTFASRK